MNQPDTNTLLAKLQALPPQRLAEVEDFVDFLHHREADHQLTLAFAYVTNATFANVWDNEDAAEYDRL